MRRRHRRENKILKLLVQCAAILAAGITGIILFMLLIWWRSQSQPPQTDEQVAAIMQQEQQAEPLVIETPEPATKGSIRVFDYDGCCIYAYYGEIVINNDGKDGKEIDIECAGYLEGYEEHKDTEREADNE